MRSTGGGGRRNDASIGCKGGGGPCPSRPSCLITLVSSFLGVITDRSFLLLVFFDVEATHSRVRKYRDILWIYRVSDNKGGVADP